MLPNQRLLFYWSLQKQIEKKLSSNISLLGSASPPSLLLLPEPVADISIPFNECCCTDWGGTVSLPNPLNHHLLRFINEPRAVHHVLQVSPKTYLGSHRLLFTSNICTLTSKTILDRFYCLLFPLPTISSVIDGDSSCGHQINHTHWSSMMMTERRRRRNKAKEIRKIIISN